MTVGRRRAKGPRGGCHLSRRTIFFLGRKAYAAAATVGNASPMGLGHRGASSADPGFAEKEAAYNPRVSEGDLPLPRANQSRRTKSVLLIWVVRETSLVAFFLRYVAIPLPDTFPIVNCVATTFPGVID